jgi:hypothetical protein
MLGVHSWLGLVMATVYCFSQKGYCASCEQRAGHLGQAHSLSRVVREGGVLYYQARRITVWNKRGTKNK